MECWPVDMDSPVRDDLQDGTHINLTRTVMFRVSDQISMVLLHPGKAALRLISEGKKPYMMVVNRRDTMERVGLGMEERPKSWLCKGAIETYVTRSHL